MRVFSLLLVILMAFHLPAKTLYAEELLKADRSWDGSSFNYPDGRPEITSLILTLEEGVITRYHCHPVPTLGYVLKGKIKVETMEGKSAVFSEGESVVEVMNTLHRGTAVVGPVEVVVFYAGAQGMPNTVYPENSSGACK
jgi:quercetin dioxygenase-like cupin family protein